MSNRQQRREQRRQAKVDEAATPSAKGAALWDWLRSTVQEIPVPSSRDRAWDETNKVLRALITKYSGRPEQ